MSNLQEMTRRKHFIPPHLPLWYGFAEPYAYAFTAVDSNQWATCPHLLSHWCTDVSRLCYFLEQWAWKLMAILEMLLNSNPLQHHRADFSLQVRFSSTCIARLTLECLALYLFSMAPEPPWVLMYNVVHAPFPISNLVPVPVWSLAPW